MNRLELLELLAERPREEHSLPPDAIDILHILRMQGLAECFPQTNLAEQDLWMITDKGLELVR